MEHILLPRKIRYFILFAINTHIDYANNSKWSVRYILKATKQGAFESVFVHVLLLGFLSVPRQDFFLLVQGFSSCYHLKMGKHIAKSSSLTSSLFLHLQYLYFHSSLALYPPILILHTCIVALFDSLS